MDSALLVPRKVWVKTFGCQMNYHDTERVLSFLKELNFTKTENEEEADLLLFNTCAVRELANLKFYSALGETKRLKVKEGVMVGVGGCIAQIEADELLKKYPHLDFAYGTDVLDQINEIVYRVINGERRFAVTAEDKTSNYSIETKVTANTPQAFVNIMKGCNHFCSYCIVPFTRGREKSRALAEIVTDVKKLVDTGVSEVTLLGQNVNSFGKKSGESFVELLTKLDDINGLKRLRYTTSHPHDFSDELIKAHGTLKTLETHVHLPVQAGSNAVLERMNRKYTREHYLERIALLRKVLPEVALSTDIIVGFPNESEAEFQETMDLLEIVRFDFVYSFNYSPRQGTKAAAMVDDVPFEVKRERLQLLQKRQLEIQQQIRRGLIGQKFEVLVEGEQEKNGILKYYGRSSCNRLVHFADPEKNLLHKWVTIEATQASALALQGTRC